MPGAVALENANEKIFDGGGLARFGARDLRLPDDARNTGTHRQYDEQRSGGAQAVAAHELSGACGQAFGPRQDRLVLEMSAQIVGECEYRGVAFGRRFVHRARQNVVEIAGECARQPGRRGAACDCGRLRVHRGRLAGPPRLGMQHGVFDLDRVVSPAIGSRTGQQERAAAHPASRHRTRS